MSKLPRVILTIISVLITGLTLLRALRCWSNDSHLEHVAGAWIALAVDVRNGIFYRALYGPHGYGGTRFFPLYFLLHGGAIRILGSWRVPGYFLSAISIALLLIGCYRLLRCLGAERWLASAGLLALLAASSVQDSLLTIREDGMAAMLNVWGATVCCSGELTRRRIVMAALLFALAFATKESSIFGLAAVVLWLFLRRRSSDALRLIVAGVFGCTLVFCGIYFASGGRALAVLRLTMTSQTDFRGLLASPATLLGILPGYWAETILLPLALASLIARPTQERSALPALLFVCTLAVTLVIISTPGAAGNHLLDLHIASVVLFITSVKDWSPEFGLAACSAAALIAFISFIPVYRDVDSVPVRDQYQNIADTIGRTSKPILADNPLIPIVAGQEPYVTDAFMFREVIEKRPALAEPLWHMIDNRQFAAIVLQDNPDTDEGREIYLHYHFGGEFLQHLKASYEPSGTPGDHYLYLPRK